MLEPEREVFAAILFEVETAVSYTHLDVYKRQIFAGAQKNMGPAGLTVVIIREDLLGYSKDFTPTMFKYDIHVKNNSM